MLLIILFVVINVTFILFTNQWSWTKWFPMAIALNTMLLLVNALPVPKSF